jgi:hypothetical protein
VEVAAAAQAAVTSFPSTRSAATLSERRGGRAKGGAMTNDSRPSRIRPIYGYVLASVIMFGIVIGVASVISNNGRVPLERQVKPSIK